MNYFDFQAKRLLPKPSHQRRYDPSKDGHPKTVPVLQTPRPAAPMVVEESAASDTAIQRIIKGFTRD